MNQIDRHHPDKAHKLVGVQIGAAEATDNGEKVAVLTFGTLAGPFDFVITEQAAAVIIEAMTTAQAAMHGQRHKS